MEDSSRRTVRQGKEVTINKGGFLPTDYQTGGGGGGVGRRDK